MSPITETAADHRGGGGEPGNLHLPAVREPAPVRLAEAAPRPSGPATLAYLAEVLAIEVDERRDARRRQRRVKGGGTVPRMKRLEAFDTTASPGGPRRRIAALASAPTGSRRRTPTVPPRRLGHGQDAPAHRRRASPRPRPGAGCAM